MDSRTGRRGIPGHSPGAGPALAGLALFLLFQAAPASAQGIEELLLRGDGDAAMARTPEQEAGPAPEGESEDQEARRLARVQNRLLMFGREHAAKHESALSALARHRAVSDWLDARSQPTLAGFRDVVARHPGFRTARRSLATLLADDGEWNEASKIFESLLTEGPPDDWETPHRFAFACYDRGETARALDLWHLAVERNPAAADPWYGLAAAWLGRGLFESALTALDHALRADPLLWKAREARVQALTGLGRHEDAAAERSFLRARVRWVAAIRDAITVAVIPRPGGAVVVREALRPGPWVWRVETFDQARGGGKPIKVTELRQAGNRYSWGDLEADGSFRERSSVEAPPDLRSLLEEAR